jgi:shikimate dehydrogenase
MVQISGKTKLIPILGNPVTHSISPAMHNEGFRLLGLDYVYVALEVEPKDFPDAVQGLKALGVPGFNLTMPFKSAVLPFLDEMSPAARLIGAANIMVFSEGRLQGHTTDGMGYMRSLREKGHDIIGKKMTILGAGSAGSSIVAQAALDGVAEINLFDRSTDLGFWKGIVEFASTVAKETACKITVYDIADLSQLKTSISESVLLVNATRVGMKPYQDQIPLGDCSFLFPELIVSDIIYEPWETLLLQEAKKIGCPTLNGYPMLLYQGAEAFRLWTGHEMPVEKVRAFLQKG